MNLLLKRLNLYNCETSNSRLSKKSTPNIKTSASISITRSKETTIAAEVFTSMRETSSKDSSILR